VEAFNSTSRPQLWHRQNNISNRDLEDYELPVLNHAIIILLDGLSCTLIPDGMTCLNPVPLKVLEISVLIHQYSLALYRTHHHHLRNLYLLWLVLVMQIELEKKQ